MPEEATSSVNETIDLTQSEREPTGQRRNRGRSRNRSTAASTQHRRIHPLLEANDDPNDATMQEIMLMVKKERIRTLREADTRALTPSPERHPSQHARSLSTGAIPPDIDHMLQTPQRTEMAERGVVLPAAPAPAIPRSDAQLQQASGAGASGVAALVADDSSADSGTKSAPIVVPDDG